MNHNARKIEIFRRYILAITDISVEVCIYVTVANLQLFRNFFEKMYKKRWSEPLRPPFLHREQNRIDNASNMDEVNACLFSILKKDCCLTVLPCSDLIFSLRFSWFMLPFKVIFRQVSRPVCKINYTTFSEKKQ